MLGPGDQQTAMQALLDKNSSIEPVSASVTLLKPIDLLGYFIKHSHIESLTWKLNWELKWADGNLVGLAWSLKGSLLA